MSGWSMSGGFAGGGTDHWLPPHPNVRCPECGTPVEGYSWGTTEWATLLCGHELLLDAAREMRRRAATEPWPEPTPEQKAFSELAHSVPVCDVYWGSHGCDLPRGHSGGHRCDCCECPPGQHPYPEDEDGPYHCVATAPYYGWWSTVLYGDDVSFGERVHMAVTRPVREVRARMHMRRIRRGAARR